MLDVVIMSGAARALAAEPPQQGDFLVTDFRFHTGEVPPMPAIVTRA